MLQRKEPEEFIFIGQPAHARVSGQLARAWGNERFGDVAPWKELRFFLCIDKHDSRI